MANLKSMLSSRGVGIDPDSVINLQLLIESRRQSMLLESLAKVIDTKMSQDNMIQKAQLLFQYQTDRDITEDDKKTATKLDLLLEESKQHTALLTKISNNTPSYEDYLEQKRNQQEQLDLQKKQIREKEKVRENKDFKIELNGLTFSIAAAIGAAVGVFKAQIKAMSFLQNIFVKSMSFLQNAFTSIIPKSIKTVVEKSITLFTSGFTKSVASFTSGLSMMYDLAKVSILDKFKNVISFSSKVVDTVSDLFKAVTKPISDAIKYVKKVFSLTSVFEPLAKIFSGVGMFGKVISSVSKIVSKIFLPLNIILTVWETVKGAIEGFEEEGVVGAIKGAVKGFYGWIFSLADLVKKMFSWVSGLLGFEGIEKALDSFSFEDLFKKVLDAIFFIPLQIQKFIMSPIESLTSMFNALKNIEIPEISVKIPFIDKKFSIGPFKPFSSSSDSTTINKNNTSSDTSTSSNVNSKAVSQVNSSASQLTQNTTTIAPASSASQIMGNSYVSPVNTNMSSEAITSNSSNLVTISTPRQMTSNVVYNSSAEVAPSSQKTQSNTSIVSAPTNVVSQTSNINVSKHTRNQDSTYSQYLRGSFMAV